MDITVNTTTRQTIQLELNNEQILALRTIARDIHSAHLSDYLENQHKIQPKYADAAADLFMEIAWASWNDLKTNLET